MNTEIKVLLVDDHEIVRAGFSKLLSAEEGIQVVGQMDSGEQAVKYVRKEPVDVVVMDINMEEMDGIKTTMQLKRMNSEIKVIMLSIHETEPFISKSFDAGTNAYLSKRCAPDELCTAIREVQKGNPYLSNDVSRHIALGKITKEKESLSTLTQREFEILRLLIRGLPMVNIAERLHISPKTGYGHRENIMRKLNIDNLVELTQFAHRHNID